MYNKAIKISDWKIKILVRQNNAAQIYKINE